MNLLERLERIIEMGQQVAQGTTQWRCRTGNTSVNAGNLHSSQSTDTSWGGAEGNIYKKVKKNI